MLSFSFRRNLYTLDHSHTLALKSMTDWTIWSTWKTLLITLLSSFQKGFPLASRLAISFNYFNLMNRKCDLIPGRYSIFFSENFHKVLHDYCDGLQNSFNFGNKTHLILIQDTKFRCRFSILWEFHKSVYICVCSVFASKFFVALPSTTHMLLFIFSYFCQNVGRPKPFFKLKHSHAACRPLFEIALNRLLAHMHNSA